MQWSALLSLALVAPYANALIRFPCAQLVTERLDPLVQPGIVSGHLHQIVGGNAFNITMNVNNDLPALSTCTSCRFKEDLSNYWTAVMYFKYPNGTFVRVPQFANTGVGSPNGGMTVYYVQPQPQGTKYTIFPKGFRMIVGSPIYRNNTFQDLNSAQGWATSFRCFGTNFGQSDGSANSPPAAGSFDTVDLPKKQCGGGIRAQIFFPSCWDGVNVNPPDHSSHMKFPLGSPPKDQGQILWSGGTCPSTHPVRTPLLFLETMWDTRVFAKDWPTDGSNPLVYSYGDPTGYGQHADYVFGWKDGALDKAMNSCTDAFGNPSSCTVLTTITDQQMNSCVQPSVVDEQISGVSALPGCNPIQNGPAPAVMGQTCGAVTTVVSAPLPTAPAPTTVAPGPGSTVVVPPPSPTTIAGAQQTHYGQCGGTGYSGPTACLSPYTCKYSNAYYSQCL